MDLNDDCWILIFSLLSLEDQILAAKACRRFHATLSSLWQIKYLNFDINDVFCGTIEHLNVLIKSICGTVESMDLGCLTFEEWDVIKLYSYPNLRNLTMMHPQPSSDEDVLEMTKVFPNLQSFHPNSPDISGRHVEKWQNLTDLSFYNCEEVKFMHFERICKEVHLKSVYLGVFNETESLAWTSEAFQHFCDLEDITLCSSELVWLSNLTLFSNLRALDLRDISNHELVLKLLRNIAEYKHNDLVELHVSVHFPLNILFVKKFENLRKMSFHQRNNAGFTDVLKYAPNLREIVINACIDLKDEDIYIWFKSDQMESVSIERCQCNFTKLKLNVKNIVQDRTKLLHFNFCKNEFSSREVALDIQGISSLLKVTTNNLDSNWFCSYRLRFAD